MRVWPNYLVNAVCARDDPMILVRLLYNDINASVFFGFAPDYDALHTYVGLKLPFGQQACGLCGVRDSVIVSLHPSPGHHSHLLGRTHADAVETGACTKDLRLCVFSSDDADRSLVQPAK
jgi:hypothetical protein